MPGLIHNSKNLLFKSRVFVNGNLHVGDSYYIGSIEKTIPLDLTAREASFVDFGQNKAVSEIIDLLKSQRTPILLKAPTGVGKSTLVKSIYANYRDEFNYAAKINIDSKLEEDFSENNELIISLRLAADFDKRNIRTSEKFKIILNRMNQLVTITSKLYNLLIIDDIDGNIVNKISNESIEVLLGITDKWRIIATSRRSIPGFHKYSLELDTTDPGFAIKNSNHPIHQLLRIRDFHKQLINSQKTNSSEFKKLNEQFKNILFNSEISARMIFGLMKKIQSPKAEDLLYFSFRILNKNEFFEDRYWVATRLREMNTELAISYLRKMLKIEKNLHVLQRITRALSNGN